GVRVAVGVDLEDGVDVAGDVAGQRVDHAGGVEDVGVEEVGRQVEGGVAGGVAGDVGAVVGVALDVAAEQAVAEAEGHRGELSGDGRVDVGVVAGVFGQGVGPEQVRKVLGVD